MSDAELGSFTFEVSYDALLSGVPRPTALTAPALNRGSKNESLSGGAVFVVVVKMGSAVPDKMTLTAP